MQSVNVLSCSHCWSPIFLQNLLRILLKNYTANNISFDDYESVNKVINKHSRLIEELLEMQPSRMKDIEEIVDEAELVRCNSTGLTIYNPQNLASMIKSMKNTTITREQKIALRKAYEQKQIN